MGGEKVKEAGCVDLHIVRAGHDYSFLAELPELKRLSMALFPYPVESLDAVHCLSKLREFHLDPWVNKTPIDFSRFPLLEKCSLSRWHKGFESVFGCMRLKQLSTQGSKNRDFKQHAKLVHLENLYINSAPIPSLEGIENLTKLRRLNLAWMRKLESIEGIQHLDKLTILDLACCHKLKNLEPVREMHWLEKLTFSSCGEIESLNPIAGLTNLKGIFFHGSTNILDGDMTPLFNLKNLAYGKLVRKSRRHYSHTINQIWEEFAKRYPHWRK
ncbi:MAG: hypothetical protein H8E27_02785 [Verrucomicrobia subdivision 3 bacterium]|nr:hypothetical protein [Limisphaerales bacterium]